MKTLDEVIMAMDHVEFCCTNCKLQFDCDEVECFLEDALHYLKTIEKTENLYHDAVTELGKWKDEDWKDRCLPLTWDELRTMEGKPVWVEQHHGDTKGWLLILRKCDDVITCTTKHGNSFYLYKANYGEKWQAYRKERE